MKRNKFDVDEELVYRLNLKHLGRLLGYFRDDVFKLLIVLFLMIVYSFSILVGPYLIKEAIDSIIPSGDMEKLLYTSILFFILIFSGGISLRYRIKLLLPAVHRALQRLRKELFDHIQELPFDYFDSRPHGKIIVRVVNYVNSINKLMKNAFITTLTELFSLFIIITFMLFISPKLTLICMTGFIPLMFLIFLIKKKQRKAWQQVSRKQSNMNAYIHESINGMKVTQAFIQEDENYKTFHELNTGYRKSWMHAVKLIFLTWPVIENISIISMSAVYFIGVKMIGAEITIGILVAFIGYLWRFWQPVINLGNSYNEVIIAAAYLERIFETIDEKVEIYDKENAVDLPPIKGNVTFNNLVFSYDNNNVILKNLNLNIESGESIALVGPTGAGKTTIVNLLSRFYNINQGSIKIDGNDINDVKISSLRRQLGIMMQDSFLFSCSIKDNIKYGKLNATDKEIEYVSRAVYAHGFIKNLPDGYDTPVEEKGSQLSTGQRQLISFARTLLTDPKILILDEATSSIDSETEKLLQKGLQNLISGRTSFIIAHRLSTIRNADRILYIDNGKIMEDGNHETLMLKKGYYYKLYNQQYKMVV
jgi:ATP-binding cassette subfamily B multidrug efflux pump